MRSAKDCGSPAVKRWCCPVWSENRVMKTPRSNCACVGVLYLCFYAKHRSIGHARRQGVTWLLEDAGGGDSIISISIIISIIIILSCSVSQCLSEWESKMCPSSKPFNFILDCTLAFVAWNALIFLSLFFHPSLSLSFMHLISSCCGDEWCSRNHGWPSCHSHLSFFASHLRKRFLPSEQKALLYSSAQVGLSLSPVCLFKSDVSLWSYTRPEIT